MSHPPAPAPQVADWLFQGLYDADWLFQGLVFVIWEGQVLTRSTWFGCTIPSSVDPARPGKLLRFQGEQLTRKKKNNLAADLRGPAKAFRIEAGVPKQAGLEGGRGIWSQGEQLGKPVCTNTKGHNCDKEWLDGNQ